MRSFIRPFGADSSVRFGAKRIDDGHLPIFYQDNTVTGFIPAQAWRLEARDYPRLIKILKWWDSHHGAEIFDQEDIGSRLAALPVAGPAVITVGRLWSSMLHLLPEKLEAGLRKDPMEDRSLVKDYALTVGGKSAAVVRMAQQNAASCRYYEKKYRDLNLGGRQPVYEIELLQSAFWNRRIPGQEKLLDGKLRGITQTLLLNVVDQLPLDSTVVFTPDNPAVNTLFRRMLESNGIRAEVFYNANLRGRTNLQARDYDNDFPVFYRMQAKDMQPAIRKLKAGLDVVSFESDTTNTIQKKLSVVAEPASLVPGAFPKAAS